MPSLFDELTLREMTIPNRIWVPPMCMYSADGDGQPADWHLAHYGAFAMGGFGLIIAEATAVVPEGRITDGDLGLWTDDQLPAWQRVVDLVHAHDVKFGIQLAHAGRKASCERFSDRSLAATEPGGWQTRAPSPLAFPGYHEPVALDADGIAEVTTAFQDSARRADALGVDVIELHAAHGYLIHEFLSPLSNTRTDAYGGSLANRARLLLEVITAVREVWPVSKPLFVRYSATDWLDGGLAVEDIATVVRWAADAGADLADVSTGGLLPAPGAIPVAPNYQVPFAEHIKAVADVPTTAVGLITDPQQAADIVESGKADAVLLGRESLRDPMWPRRAAFALGATLAPAWPKPLARGAFR